jgi:hypothetical protein
MTGIDTGRATSAERGFAATVCVWLAGCVLAFVAVSARWTLVGDVTYLHYAVFLMHHGMAPYRGVVDMNLPGTYLLESAVMAGLGSGAAGWRVYDLLLMALAAVSMISLLRPQGRLAGVFAAALFVMVHAQDGEIMSGERDFAVAVFLLAAAAVVFGATRRSRVAYAGVLVAGALLGAAVSIKPTALLVGFCLLGWIAWRLHLRGERVLPALGCALAGFALPVAWSVAFLVRHDAVAAFGEALQGLIAYHASLAHRSFGFLIGHSVSPLLPLVLTWAVTAAVLHRRATFDAERLALLACAAGGLLSYLLQQKGFAYQRYPFLGFLLVLMAGDFVRLARVRDAVRVIGVAGLLAGAVFCTIFLVRTMRFDRGEPDRPLLADLRAMGAADGQVQCMDTAGSCIDNLYAGRIVQATGFLYDCYLLDGSNREALELRRRFWQAMERNPPRLIVVTDSVCYDPVPSFDKFGRWPEFPEYLARNYTLARTSGVQRPVRYWSRAVTPFAYRIYMRR